ncbi:MAG TPA: hypothetical protein VJK53_00745 [Candidatus Paceibacterota bacterium]
MEWLTKHKLAAAAVILVITAVAWYMLSGSEEPDAVLVTETAQQIPPEAQDLLDSLRALQAVTLQSPIFSNPSFHLLKDFTTPVIAEPVGRSNPFAPLDLSVSVQGSTGTQ